MSNTTWNGSASTDWATGANWSTGSPPTTGAHVVIPDTSSINNCVLDQNRTIGSLTIQANGTLVGGGFTLNITSEGDASGGTEHFAVNNDGIISGSLNLNITTAATTSCDFAGSSGRFNDVTVNHASCVVNLESTFHIDGHLDITLGKIICGGNTVEITGRTDIGPASGSADQATLQCDASAMFLGSGRTGSFALVVNQGGTFTGGSGNHTIGSIDVKNNSNAKCTLTSGVTTLDGESASDNYNLFVAANGTFAHGSGTVTVTFNGISFFEKTSGTLTLNNLIINHASADISTNSNLTCAGDVTLTAGKLNGRDDAISFGSLTIASGGTYQATSGTTTITSFNSSNDIFRTESGGTFTHNNGTVKVTTNNSGKYFRPTNVTFYNVQISNNDAGAYVRWRGTPCTISNDLTIDANSKFKPHSETQVLNVTGEVILSGTNSFLDGNDPNNDASTQDWSFGSLTINSGATYRATSGTTIMKGALRNVGGTIS